MKRYIALLLLFTVALLPNAEARRRWIPSVVVAGGTPTVSSASITAGNAGVTSLVLGFDQSCSIGAGGSGGMTVAPSGGAATLGTPTGFPGATGTWAITDRYILSSETVTRSYTQPGNGIEATSGGGDLATFTTQAVTNNSNVVAYDLFTRADAGTLGANWTDVLAGIGIVSNQASATGVAVQAISKYTATTPTADARCSITLRTTPDASHEYNLYLRFDDSLGNGYGVVLDSGSTITIYRFDLFATTSLGTTTVAFSSGDVFGFSISGSVCQVWKNGVSVLTGSSDSTYSTAKPAMVGVQGTGSVTIAFDNFVLQNLP